VDIDVDELDIDLGEALLADLEVDAYELVFVDS